MSDKVNQLLETVKLLKELYDTMTEEEKTEVDNFLNKLEEKGETQ